MKYSQIQKMTDEKLNAFFIKLKEDQVLASCSWGLHLVNNKEAGLRGQGSRGDKTSLQKDFRRTIAKVKTEIRAREIKREKEDEN